MSTNGMYDIFKEAIDAAYSKYVIMKKVKQGEELTKEEYDQLLQSIYSESKENVNGFKQLTSLKSQLFFKGIGVVTKPAKSCSGMSKAMFVISRGAKEYSDNYRQVLQGVTITSNNLIKENAYTLVLQHQEANKYGDSYVEFFQELQQRSHDYRRDYYNPVGEEQVMAMQEAREKVVELSGQYVKKR